MDIAKVVAKFVAAAVFLIRSTGSCANRAAGGPIDAKQIAFTGVGRADFALSFPVVTGTTYAFG